MISLLFTLIIFVAALPVLYRLCVAHRTKRVIAYAILTFVQCTLLFFVLIIFDASINDLVSSMLIFIAIAELFLFFVTLIENSLTLKALNIVFQSNEISSEEIVKLSNVEKMITSRLERLQKAKFVRRGEEAYEITKRGKNLVHLFNLLSKFFGRKPSSIIKEK